MASKITQRTLVEYKGEGRRITMLTAYDASFARQIEEAGIDSVLVGDSLGNVIQGRKTTVPVSIDEMVYHTRCVSRGLSRALLIADMPFMTVRDSSHCLDAATALMQAGAEMVKIEGAGPVVERVRELSGLGIPVCAHLGLTPQTVHKLGGFRVQGRGQEAAARLQRDATALEVAGAGVLVLECVPRGLAAGVAASLEIPVIGIGAGAEVDGQVLVLYDALGITPISRPRFSQDFLASAGNVPEALRVFAESVREGSFPGPEHGWDD